MTDQAVPKPCPTVREAAQRVVDAREASKAAWTARDKFAQNRTMYEFEEAFDALRVVLALPDALAGSDKWYGPCGRCVHHADTTCSCQCHEAAPGAVETPCLSAILDDQRHKDHCDRMHPADIYSTVLGPCTCGVTTRSNGAKVELAALEAAAHARPSAERILTQATDEQIEACANEICQSPGMTVYRDTWFAPILRKHFPARSGAAVVMPDPLPDPELGEGGYASGVVAGWNECRVQVQRLNRGAP